MADEELTQIVAPAIPFVKAIHVMGVVWCLYEFTGDKVRKLCGDTCRHETERDATDCLVAHTAAGAAPP